MDGLPDAPPQPPQQKRDEWSEGGISRLLQAYEAKWLLRNRAKLKWSDWVDIANDVSAHCCSSDKLGPGGTAKTPNQCKNKVESMKKRYRAESAAAARAGTTTSTGAGGGTTSWRFFGRMDGLLKGPAVTSCSGQAHTEPRNSIATDLLAPAAKAEPEANADASIPALRQQLPDAAPAAAGTLSDLLNADANGSATERVSEKADRIVRKEAAADSDAANVSSPRSKEEEANGGGGAEEVDDVLPSRKRKGPAGSELDVARSIELLASSFVKIERARMEMYRDTERMRAEAEVRKGELELKRTEIMAKTQLQIARLFAKRLKEFGGSKNGGSSSEMDGRAKKGENGSG